VKLAREDLRRLRLPLAAALILATAGSPRSWRPALLLAGERTAGCHARRAQGGPGPRHEVEEEERDIRENLVHYRDLVKRGIVGPERRLDWIDAITGIKNARRLFEIRYAIEPQRPLDYPGVATKGNAGFMVSRMKLDMLLLHEEDLLGFLADLNASGKATSRCATAASQRAEQGAPSRTITPKLRANCTIDLITLRGGATT